MGEMVINFTTKYCDNYQLLYKKSLTHSAANIECDNQEPTHTNIKHGELVVDLIVNTK